MTREQLIRRMHTILIRRRDALRQSLAGELSQLNTSAEPTVGDRADQAVDDDYGLVNSNLAEAESRELAQIEHALERLREGSYGQCEGCGKPIPVARLQALPYATMCVKCQEAVERENQQERPAERWSQVSDEEDEESPADDFELVM